MTTNNTGTNTSTLRDRFQERMQAPTGADAAKIGGVPGVQLPGVDEVEENTEVVSLQQEEQVVNTQAVKVKAKKKDTSKSPLLFNKQNKAVFSGPIAWEAKTNKDIQVINGSFFYFKQENMKFKNLISEYDLSLLEAVHILIANAIENGMPEEMVQRYLEAKGEE